MILVTAFPGIRHSPAAQQMFSRPGLVPRYITVWIVHNSALNSSVAPRRLIQNSVQSFLLEKPQNNVFNVIRVNSCFSWLGRDGGGGAAGRLGLHLLAPVSGRQAPPHHRHPSWPHNTVSCNLQFSTQNIYKKITRQIGLTDKANIVETVIVKRRPLRPPDQTTS